MAGHDPTPRRRLSWGRILLILSLGANLLIVGFLVGALLKGGGPRDPGGPPGFRELGLLPFARALPDEGRRALSDRLRSHDVSLRERRDAMRREFEALLAALRAEPYDAAAVETSLASQLDEVQAALRLGRTLLAEHLAAMTPQERAAYADMLERDLRRWKAPPPRPPR